MAGRMNINAKQKNILNNYYLIVCKIQDGYYLT